MTRSWKRAAVAAVSGGVLALTACTGGGVSGSGGGDGDLNLRYAFYAPAASFPAVQMEEWKKELEERTDGQVTVELFVGGTLLGSGDIYDGVSSGTVDVGMDSPAYDTGRFPFSSVINLPVGYTDSAGPSEAFLELLEEYEPAEFEDFEVITAFTTEPAYLQTQQPVRNRADIRGMELRGSGAQLPFLQQLGASPTAMPMPEVAQNLQTGVISGYASSREVLKDFGLAEQVSSITDYPLGVSNSFVAVMDKERYDALPDDVKEVIEELKSEMVEFTSELHDGSNVTDALTFAEDNGVQTVQVDQDDVGAWDQIAEDQVDTWVSDHADADFDAEDLVSELQEMADSHEGGS